MTRAGAGAWRAALEPAALGCRGFERCELAVPAGRGATSAWQGGTGRTLLLLHGGVAAGAAIWHPVLPALARRWHVVAPDLPGCGFTPRVAAARGGTRDALLDWLAQLVHGLQPAAVVAASIGGALALHTWAAREACRRPLVLVGAPGLVPFRPPPLAWALMAAFTLVPCRATLWALARGTGARSDDTPVVRRFVHGLLGAMRRPGGRAFLADLQPFTAPLADDGQRALAVSGGVRGVWGERDPFVPVRRVPTWLPRSVVDGASHYPFLDEPERFVVRLNEWLPPQPVPPACHEL